MMVHDGEQYFKVHIEKIYKHEEHIIYLQKNVTENHKEIIAHQKRLKHILEGIDKKKRINFLDGLKCGIEQVVTMDFTPSPVYRHLRVTIISDDFWC